MQAAFDAALFTLERVRTVLLALALIVLMKTAWVVILAPALTAA